MLIPPLRLQTMLRPQMLLEMGSAGLRGCARTRFFVRLQLQPASRLHPDPLQDDRVLSSRSADTLLMLMLIVAFAVVIGGVLDALRRVSALGRLEGFALPCSQPLEHAHRSDPARASEAYRDLRRCASLRSPERAPCCLTCCGCRARRALSGASSGSHRRGERHSPAPGWDLPATSLLRLDWLDRLQRSRGATSDWHRRRQPPRDQGDGNARWRRAAILRSMQDVYYLVQQRGHHADLKAGAVAGTGSDHGCRRSARRAAQKPRHHLCHQPAVRPRACADRGGCRLESLRARPRRLSPAQRRHGRCHTDCDP